MNYNKILSVAGANKQSASSAQIKRYSTEISAPKKPPKSTVQSEAVKAFLARKQKEEEMKARQAEHRKQELLELRSIARNGRRANAMAKRTKDNNFMRNFATTSELADASREQHGRSGPQWCSVRPKERVTNDIGRKNRECESPDTKRNPQRRAAPPNPPPNFYDLLKVAERKQFEPLSLPRIPKKKNVALEEQGRMMTTEEKRRFIEEQARKQGKSLTEVVVPKRTRKRYVPGQEIDSFELAVKPTLVETNRGQARDVTGAKTRGVPPQSQQARLKPSSVQVTNAKTITKDQRSVKRTEAIVRKPDERRKVNGQRPVANLPPPPPSVPQERRKYYPDVMPKKQKVENGNYDDRLKGTRNGSSSVKPVSSQQLKKQTLSAESKMKVNSAIRGNVPTNNQKLTSPSTSQSRLVQKSPTKPVSRSILPNVSSPSTSRDRSELGKPRSQLASQNRSRDLQSRQLQSREPQNRQLQARDSQNRQLQSRDTQNRQVRAREPEVRQFPPRDLMPRQFPPRDVVRRPIQRPMKRRIESDEEDEYDEEMADFIDDEPVDGENMNYSEHIKEIFGYDRSKYRYVDDEDICMESSYLQQMKEEAISAKLGILEDLEDIQREEQEMRRKAIRTKKK